MAITVEQAINYIVPLISGVVYTILGVGVCILTWYYFFIVKKRRYWLVDIKEQKSDGKLYLVMKDRLQEKKINHGKQTIYVFRKTKTESIPPSYECVDRLNGKEYCTYIRILDEYVPIREDTNLPDFNDTEVKTKIWSTIIRHLQIIRSIKTTRFAAGNVEKKYIYVPLHKALKFEVDYKPIAYDVNMMRINEIDSLDQMFKNKKDFWEKYGSAILIGGAIVLVIVVTVLSYNYSQTVVQSSLGSAQAVVDPLNRIADKLGGTLPPQ